MGPARGVTLDSFGCDHNRSLGRLRCHRCKLVWDGRVELHAVARIKNFLPLPDVQLDLAGQSEENLLTLMVAHDASAFGGPARDEQ